MRMKKSVNGFLGIDLVETFHDSSEFKYSEQKALLELTAVMESRTPR
jgi:hypothetical protein